MLLSILSSFGLKKRQIKKYSCDISYKAQIGKNISFPHPIGIVIGEGSVIEDNVMIWQNVTIGSHGKKDKEMTYPVIRSGVKLYSGCQLLGSIEIGRNAKVGAGSIVLIDVPEDRVAVGVPAQVLNVNN